MTDSNTDGLAILIDELRREYAHLKFILITAPTERCGITLFQRMFNAGGQCLIYGENSWLLYRLPAMLLHENRFYSIKEPRVREFQRRFFFENRGLDGTLLFPNYPIYTKEVLRQFYRLLECYHTDSLRHGVKYWGMKLPFPKSDFQSLPTLRLLPSIEMVILDRNLDSIAKSLCARWPDEYSTEESFRRLGYRWMRNRIFLGRLVGDKIVRVDYDQFLRNAGQTMELLEQTFGLKLERSVFTRKINVNATLTANEKYIAPASLPPSASNWLADGVRQASNDNLPSVVV